MFLWVDPINNNNNIEEYEEYNLPSVVFRARPFIIYNIQQRDDVNLIYNINN